MATNLRAESVSCSSVVATSAVVQTATIPSLYITTINNAAYPPEGSGVYGSIKFTTVVSGEIVSATSTDFSEKVQITKFKAVEYQQSVVCVPNDDHILIGEKDGHFKCQSNFSARTVGSSLTRISFAIFKNDGDTQLSEKVPIDLPADQSLVHCVVNAIASVAEDDTIEIWFQNETNTDSVYFESGQLMVEKL